MNGLPHHHFMLDPTTGAPLAAGNDPAYPGYALMNTRYAFPGPPPGAAAAPPGMDPMMYQQELRRQDMMMAGGYAAAPLGAPAPAGVPSNNGGSDNNKAALLARREDELLRLHDAHNRIMEAELAARAMRDRVAAAQQAQHQQQAQQDESVRAMQAAHQQQQQQQQQAQRIVALQEQQAARIREMEKLRQAETDRPVYGQLSTGPAPAERDRSTMDASSASAYGGLSNPRALPPVGLGSAQFGPGEAALRERRFVQQRMFEHQQQQVLQQQHQQAQQQQAQANLMQRAQGTMMAGQRAMISGAPASAAEREHLTRLLQLQQMSDEDLIRRAAEVQNAQSAALQESLARNKGVAMEQQMLEAQLLRNGMQRFQGGGPAGAAAVDRRMGLDMIDQAHADAAAASRMSNDGPSPSNMQGGQATASPLQHAANNAANNPPQQPLRYFNNGIEVDAEGNPLPVAVQQANLDNTMAPSPSQGLPGMPPPGMIAHMNAAGMDNNIIAKFLTVVVSRVPEIAPAVADLLPDGGDPMLLKREFPNVVDATLDELKSIQERFANTNDDKAFDLHDRVTNCIAAIEPYKVDLSTTGGFVPLPGGLVPHPGHNMMHAQYPGMMMMRQALPEPSMDPNACQPLMPNNPMRMAAMQHARPMYFPTHEEISLGIQRTDAYAPHKKNAFEDDSDDMPVMAAHKAKKRAAKRAKKRRKNAPKLVHKATAAKANNPRVRRGPPKLVHQAFIKAVEANKLAAMKSTPSPAFEANEVAAKKTSPSPVFDASKGVVGESKTPSPQRKTSDASAKSNSSSKDTAATPKLVQHALFKGAFDANGVGNTKTPSPARKRLASDASVKSNASSKSNVSKESASSEKDTEVKPSSNTRSMKKRRISDQSDENSEANIDSLPVSNIYQKKGQVKNDSKCGPHGELLNELFGGKDKQQSSTAENDGDATKKESKPSTEDEEKKEDPEVPTKAISGELEPKPSNSATNSVVTEESEDKAAHTDTSSKSKNEDESQVKNEKDANLDAASVLLGLMGGANSS